MKIVLATKSLCRQEAFKFLGLDFIAEGSNVDEYFDGRPDNPKELVKHLAQLKAESVAKNHSEGIVIGFDSIGWFNNEILEKPSSKEEAFNRLKLLSGNNHRFYTGIFMIDTATGKSISRVIKTELFMRELTEPEINKYLEQDPNFNIYALGYDPLSYYSSTFVKKIEGSYNNFTRGIPLEVMVEMLKGFEK
jgi:septum formation protein|tara:strand:+ start:1284 stop:1859 length:576 start_codon:yes stop_codon:yes gene_type:complete